MMRKRNKRKYFTGNLIDLKPKLKVLFFMIFMMSLGHVIQAKNKLTTFRQYKLSVGVGLGFSPMAMLSAKPYSYWPYEKFKPALKLEFSIHPKFTINVGYQLEHYKLDAKGQLSYYTTDGLRTREVRNVNFRAINTATTIDIRKYTTGVGYVAPYGRFVMYGLSFNKFHLRNNEFSFSEMDGTNGSLVYTYKKETQVVKLTGIRFGLGKKRYIGKKLKSFMEYQVLMDLKLGDFGVGLKDEDLSIYNGVARNAYERALRMSQVSSILQFNIRYGFSL